MWISRGTAAAFEQMAETIRSLRDELAGERAVRIAYATRISELKIEHLRESEEFRRRLAVAQANFEWLSVSHNKVSAEWQKMFNTRASVELPPLEVRFDRKPNDGVTPTGAFQETKERPVDRSEPLGVEELLAQGLSFDDMGERAAAREGIAGRVYDGGSETLMEG